MNNEQTFNFSTVLREIATMPTTAWLYLPADKNWNLDSKCAVLESIEVPQELEDEPLAGVPDFAIRNELIQALPVTVVQEVITNARSQKNDATLEDFFRAFLYYYKHDAFMNLA